jgi:hypothetical protein
MKVKLNTLRALARKVAFKNNTKVPYEYMYEMLPFLKLYLKNLPEKSTFAMTSDGDDHYQVRETGYTIANHILNAGHNVATTNNKNNLEQIVHNRSQEKNNRPADTILSPEDAQYHLHFANDGVVFKTNPKNITPSPDTGIVPVK